jgi:hypothetical protein
MKRIIALLGIVVMAVFAFTVISVATASAEETKILPEPTEAQPLRFPTRSGVTTLRTRPGLVVTCKKDAGTEVWRSPNLGTASVLYTECTGPLSSVCTGEGMPSSLIAINSTIHFWLALLMTGTKEKETTELITAFVALTASVTFTCVNATKTLKDEVVVKSGCAAAQALPESLNKLISESTATFAQWSTGEQAILSVLPEESTKALECSLQVSVNGGTVTSGALEGSFVAEKFEKSGTELTIELMH